MCRPAVAGASYGDTLQCSRFLMSEFVQQELSVGPDLDGIDAEGI
jgi:hypothetical protein